MFPGGQPQNMQLHGGQLPVVQYPGMYYNAVNPVAAPAWQSQSNSNADDGRDLLAQSYERMRNEMRSLQGGAKPDAPPPPSMDSSRDNAAIKMLLNNENVSLSSLLEAAMDPSAGSNKGTEDPIMKKTVLDKCEGKIAQLYRHRISGMGTFFPTVPPKGTKANSSCFLTFHHPRIEFNMKRIDDVWHCPEVNVEAGQVKQTAKAVVEGNSVKPKRAKSPALKAAEVYANKPNPLVSPNLVGYSESKSEKPDSPSGRIPVIGPSSAIGLHPVVGSHPVVDPHQNVQTIDLTRPPPITTSHPEPPPDPYATTAFELWAEIERERRHKEKLQEWDMLNEKHKERDREKEERKRKKKRHRHHRSRSRSRSRNRRRSRSYSRSRSKHGERRYRSRSRRRTRTISLSPSPSQKRFTSPLIIRRFSRSPPRRSPPRRSPSPRPLRSIPPLMYSNEPVSRFQPGPPGSEWPTSSAWPSSTSYGPPASEFHDPYGGRQVYPEGDDNYYGNDGTYPPYNMPPNYYGMRAPFPPRGYHQMNGPPRWMPPSYGYRPPMNVVTPPSSAVERSKTVTKRTTAKSATPNQNLVDVSAAAAVKVQRNDSEGKNIKPESNIKVTSSKVHPPQKPSGEVIILDDDDVTSVKTGLKPINTSVDHPPGVSPDRELPQLPIRLPSEKESEFTKPLRAKFKELLKPFEKILDTLKNRQRDSYEYKTLIKGLEIGTCEFDGVYTLVEGILCRVVIDSKEGAKTCFKIVLSPTHVTPILMEIHRLYHDYTAYKIQETIDDLFYDVKLFPSWKIVNVIKICKICKSEAETQRKKKEEMQQKSPERHESNDADKESRSKSKSHRRRSVSKGRDDRKKSRRGSKDDRDRQEKTSSHSSKKREELNDASVNVITESFKKECPKQTSAGGKKITDLSGNKLRTIESVSSDAPGSKTVEVNTVEKSARSNTNHSKSPDASTGKKNAQPNFVPSVKQGKSSKIDGASEKDDANDGSSPLNRDSESLKPEGQLVDPVKPRKPLVPYGIGKNNKPEDFKVRVRKAQLSVDDLKMVIASLEGPAKHDVDTNYLLKAGMLCKRVPTPAEQKNVGKSEVKIAVTPESLLKMIQIVHTMAATHAPIEKTIAVFNKHFTPIKGVQEAVLIVLNNCEVCKSL